MDTQTMEQRRYGRGKAAAFTEAQAELIGAEVEEIIAAKPTEGITAERLVEAAAEGAAPTCASVLTWDDALAGHRWRVHEARLVLNHITLIEADESSSEASDEKPIRAFHVVNVDVTNGETHKERRYVPLSIIREDEDLVEQVIEQAREEFIRAKTKLSHYEAQVREHAPELARVMDAVTEHLDVTGGEAEEAPLGL